MQTCGQTDRRADVAAGGLADRGGRRAGNHVRGRADMRTGGWTGKRIDVRDAGHAVIHATGRNYGRATAVPDGWVRRINGKRQCGYVGGCAGGYTGNLVIGLAGMYAD